MTKLKGNAAHTIGNGGSSHLSESKRNQALLCGTALASTLLIGTLAASPASAQVVNLPGQVAPVNVTNSTNCNLATDCILITTPAAPQTPSPSTIRAP